MEAEKMPDPKNKAQELARSRVLSIRDKIYLLRRTNPEKLDEAMVRMAEFAKNLREKYPDANKRVLFHLFSGSGKISGVDMTLDDFTGEDSIEKFMLDLEREYLQDNK